MKERFLKYLPWAILGFGALLRIGQFIFNRSVTEGEAALALNIMDRSYSGLLKPLDLVQAAPYGFLVVQKTMLNIFGNNDYSLRIVPLVAGLVALGLFWRFAKGMLAGPSLAAGLLLFAAADQLIYFSSELKQYSTDVTVGLLIAIFIVSVLKNGFNRGNFVGLAFCFGLGIWFSHSALFFLSAGGILFLVFAVRRHIPAFWLPLLALALIFGASFWANYKLSLRSLASSRDFLDFWQYAFMPFPPRSPADLKWFGLTFLRIFRNPGGFPVYLIPVAGAFFILGLIRTAGNKAREFWILILPAAIALLASGFHKYPFDGRLMLFIMPALIILIAAGVEAIIIDGQFPAPAIGRALALIMIAPILALASYRLIAPRQPEELRPVMQYLRSEYRTGDVIYLYYGAVNGYDYYSRQLDFHPPDPIRGVEARDQWDKYYAVLKALRPVPRAWIVFSHIANWGGVDEERIFLDYLDRLGRRLGSFKTSGASAYLYALR